MYSTTYIATIAVVLAQILPKFGIEIGSEALTTTITTLVTLGGGLWILVQRYKKGGVSILGVKN